MPLLSYQQLQQAVLRDGRNGVLTHVQRDQRIHQRLSMHAHQMAAAVRQLAAGKRHRQAFAQALVDSLIPLNMREYSIASIPQDGLLQLLVRQERHADGSLGIGSGWLTEHAEVGSAISLRLRRNSAFHLPGEPCPLILLGNGTGLAGLRSLLKARIAEGQQPNWLLFGERNEAHDFYFREELQG